MNRQSWMGFILGIATVLAISGCGGDRQEAVAATAPPAASVQPSGVQESPTVQVSPSVSVTPTPQAEATPTETGLPHEETPTAQKPVKLSALKPIYAVGKGNVAITIDDGPTKDTGKLLKVLRDCDTKVTFFFLGQNVEKYHQSVTEAVYDKHAVGYHSDVHPQMAKMTYEDQEKEFNSGLKKLEKWSKQQVTLFRPPYGSYNNDTKLITEDHHMSMVLWNEDPKDWDSNNAATITKNVLSLVKSGSVIVMHDHPSTIEALPAIIDGIRKKGYQLVTVPAQ